MQGRPVWLASVSRRSRNGKCVSALKLPRRLVLEAERVLRRVLYGVGDSGRERLFQMCVTTCMHRALSDQEIEMLPDGWTEKPALDVAGGPVRVLASRGIPPGTLSVEPCEDYGREPFPGGLVDADGDPLWIPVDCGECPPCRARVVAVEATR